MKLLALALFAISTPSPAAEVVRAELPQKDDIIEVTAAATPLRESTPDALFGGKAPQKGWARKDEPFRVNDSRQYLTIYGMEIWLKVEKVDEPAVNGWVLEGVAGDISKGKANFRILRSAHAEEAHADARATAAEEAGKKADSLVEDME